MKLVWNAIVKNEAAIIERCVNSLLPHVDGAVIVDTGSTDDTPAIILDMFHKAGKPAEVRHVPFTNFEQARNAALKVARESDIEWDYLLLADADMELKVKQQPWLNGEKGLSYDLRQTSGSLGYYNRRLVSRDATGWYVGVTHEYLDVPASGALDGAEFLDHADGANRPEKLKRDVALLEMALKTETRPGLIQRYHFYLASSYFDLGEFDRAAQHYCIRTALGGFEEERWYAQYRYAVCLRNLGEERNFLWEMLEAHNARSWRPEPLYQLANFYREKGNHNYPSILYSLAGMQLAYPKSDLLFVDEWIYKYGLKEEFAICAYYTKHLKQGAKVCDELVLMGSGQARGNQYWYLEPLVNAVPSFKPWQIDFTPPADWTPLNPSIINDGGQLKVLVRTVNYTITPEGQYEIRSTSAPANSTNPINTRNYIVSLDNDLGSVSSCEIQMPSGWEPPKYSWVIGFEDSRLFKHQGQLWTMSTVRELNELGLCQQVAAQLVNTEIGGAAYSDDYMVFESHQGTHEKNWMPWPDENEMKFVYRLGSLINTTGGHGFHRDPKIAVNQISGGSQVVDADGTKIAMVHEANFIPGKPNRFYQHRFVLFDNEGGLMRISPPFVLHDRQIEFVAGLAYLPKTNQLVASYGIRDCEAWLATMDLDQVLDFIDTGREI